MAQPPRKTTLLGGDQPPLVFGPLLDLSFELAKTGDRSLVRRARKLWDETVGTEPLPRWITDPDEMTSVFRIALRVESKTRGRAGYWRFCLGAYTDTLRFASLGWLSTGRERVKSIWQGSNRSVSSSPRSNEITAMAMASPLAQTRFGIRSLSKTPLVACVAVVTIALAVGLTAVTVSVVYGTTLRPLPFAGGDRIMSIELAVVLAHLMDRVLILDGAVSPPANLVDYGDAGPL